MPRIKVLRAGLQSSVQDAGRRGLEHLGVTVGGWVDDFAPRWANRLLGNDLGAAVLEFTLLGPDLEAADPGWVALTGADMGAAVNGRTWPPGTTRQLLAGDRLTFGGATRGARAYLAAAGGIDVPVVLASKSTDLVAGFGGLGGRALQPGDEVRYMGGGAESVRAPVDTCRLESRIRILSGVRSERFPPESWQRLVGGSHRVTDQSDRLGLRLHGPAISDTPVRGDHLSEGMAIGSIEVAPSGELLVLLKARGSIGGYSTLAHVAAVDWPTLGQLGPGDEVRFVEVGAAGALNLLQEREALFNRAPVRDEPRDPGRAPASASESVDVRAPVWCIIHGATLPGRSPLVGVGDLVRQGQTLAIFEVMTQFYDLDSPSTGRIISKGFADGDVVTEGTLLFVIAPG
ncbi:MAG: biotin/lipoyl-containing protein [Candidatus Dormibacteria bacterium]